MEVLGRQTATFWVASASVAAMLIGAIGPWMEILGHGRPGTDRSGAWVIAVAAIAALFVWQHTQHGGIDLGVAGMSLGLIGAAICALDLYEILSMPAAELPHRRTEVVSAGWGIYLSLLGSLTLAGASYLIRRDPTY